MVFQTPALPATPQDALCGVVGARSASWMNPCIQSCRSRITEARLLPEESEAPGEGDGVPKLGIARLEWFHPMGPD